VVCASGCPYAGAGEADQFADSAGLAFGESQGAVIHPPPEIRSRTNDFRKKESQVPNIGPLEIGIVLVIALIVFGPKKLPELGKSLGKGINEFKGSIGGAGDDGAGDEAEPRKIAAAPSAPSAPAGETRREGQHA
jgi:sec-independent protein translocase protein TatA